MKKYLLLLLTLVFAMTSYADKVTEQQALQKAQRFFKGKQIVSKSLTRSMTRGDQSASQEDFYVFNAEKNGGFVIISGDDRTPEVLGYADSGSLDLNNLPPNLKGWMEEYSKQIKALDNSGITQRVNTSRAVTRTIKTPVEPLITTKWGQYGPYNLMCPVIDGQHCVTGCVATAMAQIMYYHKCPQDACAEIPAYTTGTREIQMDALPPTTFKWDKMKESYRGVEQGESTDAVAELMLYCGQAVKMDYDIGESGSGEAPWHFMKYFGYGKNAKQVKMFQHTITQWEDILYNELNEKRPILYEGVNLGSGHEFICDGFDGNGYFHFNWGWEGVSNGYFLLSLLYQDFSGGFVNAQGAIIGLQPDDGESEIPYVYSYLGLTNTEYTRSSMEEDFTNISLRGGISIQYASGDDRDVSLDYGLGLFKDGQLLTVLDHSSAILNSSNNKADKQMNVAFGKDLEDGVYQIRAIYKLSREAIWIASMDSYINYVIVTVTGDNLRLRISSNTDAGGANYIVNNVSYSGKLCPWHPIEVTINLTNTGDSNQEMIYFWSKKNGETAFHALACGMIEPGKTGDVVLSLNNLGGDLGERSVLITADKERKRVIWEDEISIVEANNPSLTISNVLVDHFENGILKDSRYHITCSITNTSDNVFDDQIVYTLDEGIPETDSKPFFGISRFQSLKLNPGETKQMDFSISVENDKSYHLWMNYYGKDHDVFNLLFSTPYENFYVATYTTDYNGLNYAYIPSSKTASVIPGDYNNMESVIVPSSISIGGTSYQVTKINQGAFKGCSLLSVSLPEGLISIGGDAFSQCDIKSINLPSTLRFINSQAFMSTRGLKEIVIPEGVLSISYAAFSACIDLEVLRLPSTLKSISLEIIFDCQKLKSVYSAMAQPIDIPEYAFGYTSNPPSATLRVPTGTVEKYQAATGWNIFTKISDQDPVITEYEGLNYECEQYSKTASVIAGDYQKLESINIPSTIIVDDISYHVEEISSRIFEGCNVQSISLPSTLKRIGSFAFNGVTGVKEFLIPEGVVSIGMYAFAYCNDLMALKIPSTLESIGNFAFGGCNNLRVVSSGIGNPISIQESTFVSDNISSTILKVPTGSVETYQGATGWNVFSRITDKNVHKLIYQVDGAEYKAVYVVEDDVITPESSPEATDTYQFSGWSEIPETMPDHDVIVTGTFVRHFDVGHVVNVVNYIMNANATAEQITLYDLNCDNELNIGDIILIVKSILNNGNSGSNPAQTRTDNNVNLSQYTAAQFVLNVDRGVAIKNIQLVSNMTNSHQMMYSKLDDNTYYVVIYSLSNQLMKPENNNIVKVETDDGGFASITMHDLIVSTINGETESYKGSLSTGIHQVDNEGIPAAIYDLKGQRLDGAKSQKKGLYIINGKKVVVK